MKKLIVTGCLAIMVSFTGAIPAGPSVLKHISGTSHTRVRVPAVIYVELVRREDNVPAAGALVKNLTTGETALADNTGHVTLQLQSADHVGAKLIINGIAYGGTYHYPPGGSTDLGIFAGGNAGF